MVGWALNSSHNHISLGVGKAAAEPMNNLHSRHGILSLRWVDTIVGGKATATGDGEAMATVGEEIMATRGWGGHDH